MSEQNGEDPRSDTESQPRIYDVYDVSDVFLDEWILMRVTERDEYGVPARGEILEHGKRRRDIQPRLLAGLDTAKETGDHYYVFRAFPRLRPGEKYHCLVDELLEQAVKAEQREE